MSNSSYRCMHTHSLSLLSGGFTSLLKATIFLLFFNLIYLNLNAQLPCNPPLLRPHIDGNPCEWPGLLGNVSFSSGFEHDIFNVSTSSDDQYTQGSSDPDPLANWTWNLGNTNNKTDIANAGSFMKNLGTEQNPENHLYFFGDRTSLNGDANFGFWFFRNAVGLKPLTGSTSTFDGTHTFDTNPNDANYTGDIFIVSAFEGGGAHPKMKIYNLIVANNQAGFTFQVITEIDPGVSTAFGNAAVNTQTFPVPVYTRGTETWQYATSGGDPDYPSTTKIVKVNGQNTTVFAGAFFEGDLNLTALGISPCFSTFLLSTRNSQSLNASLQDFVTGELNITPPPPTTTGGEVCFPNALVLSANCSGTGSSPKWYTAATGGTALTTSDGVSADGSTLTIPANSAAGTYTYYVSCRANGINCESERVIVTGRINPKPTIDGLITNDNTSPFDMVLVSGVEVVDAVVDEFNLNTNVYKVVNFTATSTGGTNPTTFVWAELNPSGADDISFTYNADGSATFTVNSLTGISDFYDFRVTGTDAKGCTNTDDVRIKIRRSSPPCLVTGPAPCPGTTANYKYDPDNNGVADPIPDGFTALWDIVAPNTNGATTSGSTTGNNVNVATQLNCNSQFTIRITLTSLSGLSTVSCQKTVNVIDNTPPVITNCPADINIACGVNPTPANTGGPATATDECTVIVTFTDVTVENCSRKAITRTWKATDPCGNTSTCTQLITITDAVAPVITCPANKTVALGTALTCGASTLPANTGTATAVDACSNSSVIVYYKDAPQQNNNVNCANISRTWYAVDASGNVSSCVQTIEFAAPVTQANFVEPGTSNRITTQINKEAPVNPISEVTDNIGKELKVKAYPNPFSSKITFVFTSPISGKATLEVYNIMGQRLGTVYEGFVRAGDIQNIQYNARFSNENNLIYKLRVNDKTAFGKLIQTN